MSVHIYMPYMYAQRKHVRIWYMYLHMQAYLHTHRHNGTRRHNGTYACMHTHTHTHTCIYAHRHKHTHTQKCVINYIHTHIPAKYCIMQSFGRGKPWWIYQITGGLPNFTVQILTMSHDINKESKQIGICQSFIRQKFLMENLPRKVFLRQKVMLYGTLCKCTLDFSFQFSNVILIFIR